MDIAHGQFQKNGVLWVDSRENPVTVSRGMAANCGLEDKVKRVEQGEVIGNVQELVFRDPNYFRAGELHSNATYWEEIAQRNPSSGQNEILRWIRERVSIFPYFKHLVDNLKAKSLIRIAPREKRPEDLDGLPKTGAISWLGRVGEVEPPFLVLPFTVEPTKPRLCHDARFLNPWMEDKPFTLDTLNDLPRYVAKDSYQTVLDDKSGYDHILLSEDSRTFFGIQWEGWYFTYNTLPFGWKISPYVYHSTGLMASAFFRSIRVPCLLYIDDRHNGQLQVPLDKGEYSLLKRRTMRVITLLPVLRSSSWLSIWCAWAIFWAC